MPRVRAEAVSLNLKLEFLGGLTQEFFVLMIKHINFNSCHTAMINRAIPVHTGRAIDIVAHHGCPSGKGTSSEMFSGAENHKGGHPERRCDMGRSGIV